MLLGLHTYSLHLHGMGQNWGGFKLQWEPVWDIFGLMDEAKKLGLDDEERLRLHQRKSSKLMKSLKKWLDRKIKKTDETLTLNLVRNPDILSAVSRSPDRPFCVGFAAETNDLEAYAEAKRRAKGLDMIAANQVSATRGMEADDNALLVIWEGGKETLGMQSKARLAEQLVNLVVE
mgnify:CR=1 FL=1